MSGTSYGMDGDDDGAARNVTLHPLCFVKRSLQRLQYGKRQKYGADTVVRHTGRCQRRCPDASPPLLWDALRASGLVAVLCVAGQAGGGMSCDQHGVRIYCVMSVSAGS